MYLTTFLILSLHVAIIVIFHSLHTFPFLKLLISGFIHGPSHCDLQRHKHLPLIVTTKHPCSFTLSFNCTGFFLGIWSTSPLSYPSRQILHDSSERSQPCIHGIHSILASVSLASQFTHQGHHVGPLVYWYSYITHVHYLHVLYIIHTPLVWVSGFLIGSSLVH